MKTTPAASGFTLLELLVVLTIIGLLLATIPGSLFDYLPSMRQRKTTADIVDTLRVARNDAVTEGIATAVDFDAGTRDYWRIGNATPRSLPQDLSFKFEEFPADLRHDDAAEIRFLPDGSSSGGEIVVHRTKKDFVIEVDWLSGRVDLHG